MKKFLRLQGVNVSHVSVYKWIGKYIGLMNEYANSLTPSVSDKWRTDEVYLKMRGNMKYLFAMMDDGTRFWIAQQVTDDKFTADVRPLFLAEGKKVAGKKPTTLITDGGMQLHQALQERVLYCEVSRGRQIAHPRHQIRRDCSQQQDGADERRNPRQREGDARLKRTDTPILKGLQVFHNFIDPMRA